MAGLIAKYRVAQARTAELERELHERERRIQDLSGQLRELNQRRQDAAKRIDDLIQQVAALDAKFERAAES